VLVVDDDATIHELLIRQLTREGFAVFSASSGADALSMARKIIPDIITLDVMMPGIDGWQVLSELKADPELRDIPVVMISMLENRTQGINLGAVDYLTKPVDRNQLIETLRRYLPGGKQSNYHVLIIEDDSDTQSIFKRTVEHEGWYAQVAGNGRIGLEAMALRTPDIILLDLMMPEMDGLQFLSAIRTKPAWQNIPVICVTAKTLTEDERKLLRDKAQQVLRKGDYATTDLAEQIRGLLSGFLPGQN
jgi:CheY-like chemotaxis protein